jgi:tetratricopeptide (TPR) repeat protein
MDRLALSLRAALILLATAACTAAVAQTADERLAAQERLRAAVSTGRLEEAAVHADTVLSLTEERFGKDSRELVNPLTNAGTVALRRGELAVAEGRYQRAVALIEGGSTAGGADRDLIRPLTGLGETWLAAARPADAALAFKRAVDLSRNLDGLYNLAQLDIVDPLIESYVAAGRPEEADREQVFAFRIAESAYGRNDLRLLDPLDRLARWRESQGRYTTARGLHARALQIAELGAKTTPPVAVPALRGLSRTWIGEALYGPEIEPGPGGENTDGFDPFPTVTGGTRLNPEGERVLRFAVDLLRVAQPVDHAQLGETLAQLGDWYLVTGAAGRAAAAYAEAWRSLTLAGPEVRRLLEAPRRLVYRAPPSSVSRLVVADPAEYSERPVELRLQVAADGKVVEAKPADGNEPDPVTRSVMLAARKARYAPRLEAGVPIATEDVVLRERMLVRIPKDLRKE